MLVKLKFACLENQGKDGLTFSLRTNIFLESEKACGNVLLEAMYELVCSDWFSYRVIVKVKLNTTYKGVTSSSQGDGFIGVRIV